MGTIVNFFSILLGSLIGLLIKKGLSNTIKDSLYKVMGISVFLVGLNGFLSNTFTLTNGKLESSFELILIVSLAIGCFIGESLKIDDFLNNLGLLIEKKYKIDGFAKGFISASLIFCVGAMSILGALNDGLLKDPSILYVKSLIDGITSIILSTTSGIGVMFSGLSVLVYQGLLTLLASFLDGFLVNDLLRQICMVVYVLVMTIVLNFLFDTKIKTANLLPSLLIPILFSFIF